MLGIMTFFVKNTVYTAQYFQIRALNPLHLFPRIRIRMIVKATIYNLCIAVKKVLMAQHIHFTMVAQIVAQIVSMATIIHLGTILKLKNFVCHGTVIKTNNHLMYLVLIIAGTKMTHAPGEVMVILLKLEPF